MTHAVVEGPVSARLFYRQFVPFAVRGDGEIRRALSAWLRTGGISRDAAT